MLVISLKKSSAIGYGKTKTEIIAMAQQTIENKKLCGDSFNGEGWWSRFMSHNSCFSHCTADPLSNARADAVTQEMVGEHFKLLQTLKEKDLFDKPYCIYIMLTKVRCHWSTNSQIELREWYKKVYGRSSENKAQITIVACASAMVSHSLLW